MGVAGILYYDWLNFYREEYSSRADGFLERLLKSMNTFVKYHGGPQDIIDEAKDEFALYEAFKKEFKVIVIKGVLYFTLIFASGYEGGVVGITWAGSGT